ncbi:hypothetical protein BC937DRAFT_89578 [Endogone sp. FLAS-F59071]|nr:hypothetical protein BC937DRAFT_89578 [Endogone sp. FLAS-F59071]|eukprot:RUS23269.1 hypothetical protein BC937DRAFT_89578 [Endogone sp. FLAS-F59071]
MNSLATDGLLGDGLGQIQDNSSIGVEEIITGHTGLAGNTSGNDDNVGTLKGILEAIVIGAVTCDLVECFKPKLNALIVFLLHLSNIEFLRNGTQLSIAIYLRAGVDVAQVSGNTRSVNNVIHSKVSDVWVLLEQKGERLADATSGTKNGNLGSVLCCR